MAMRKAGVLTVSDKCFKGEAEDTSGPNLIRVLADWQELNISNVDIISKCVPDQMETIQEVLIDWVDRRNLSLILTTGGTGFSPRDITPEATKPLLDKEAPGLVTAMISKSLEITPMAMLSRLVCGIRNNSLIINLPGSKKGSEECFTFLRPTLPHALDLLSGSHQRVHQTHQEMAGSKSHDAHMISHHSCCHGHVKTHVGTRTKEDFHPVALRLRHSPYPMLSVDEALHVISQNTPSHPLTEQKPLVDVLQCVLAEDIIADQPLPPFPASIKDGYAVISADGTGERDVLAPIPAGEMSSVMVVSGSVARITTGAPLPNGADAVVMVENTELIASTDDGKVEKKIKILSPVKPGQDIRPVGSDIAKGDVVLEKGSLLGPSEIGLAASVGVTSLSVYKTPQVAVLSTGNEVISPGELLGPGQIYDSNRYTLLAAIKQYDFQGIDIGIAQDTREALVEQITQGLDKADVLITSGGVSMGEKDLLKPVLVRDFNATIHFGRVFMKPGKPTTFATITRGRAQKLVFSLPGNPVSATVTFHLFVLPTLKKLAGHLNYQPTIVPAKISRPIPLDPRPEYHRVKLVWREEEVVPYVESTGMQQSSRLLSMKGADGLVVLPSKSDQLYEVKSGEMVKVMLLKN